MEENKVIFEDENGNETEFDIIEETKINNVNYVLVATSDEDDDEAYILKEESDDEEEVATYTMVDDEDEIEYIGKIFSELLKDDGVNIEYTD